MLNISTQKKNRPCITIAGSVQTPFLYLKKLENIFDTKLHLPTRIIT